MMIFPLQKADIHGRTSRVVCHPNAPKNKYLDTGISNRLIIRKYISRSGSVNHSVSTGIAA
jgi:hypothetical protein